MKEFSLSLCSLLLIASTSWLSAQEVPNPLTPVTLKARGYKLLYEDGFDKVGKPSAKDWLFRNNQKHGGISSPKNVVVDRAADGTSCLNIKYTFDKTRKNGEQFIGGGIVSTSTFGYGYYEARVKLYGGKPELAGFHQSFWSMGLTGSNEGEGSGVRDSLVNIDLLPQKNQVLEIDAFEHDSKTRSLAQNYHIYTPKHFSNITKPDRIEKDLSQWIVFGYEWLPGQINFYCDGKLINIHKMDQIWQIFAPQNLWFTALPVDWANTGGLKVPAPGAAMQVDYFKFYAKQLTGVNRLGNSDFEYGVDGESYPVAWIVSQTENNDPDAVKVVTDSISAKNGRRFLLHKDNKPYKTTTKQIISYIPNGNYALSAWVKSSGGQKNAALIVKCGDKENHIPIKAASVWTKVLLDNVAVKNNEAIIEIQSEAESNQWLMMDHMEFSEVK